MPKLIVKFEAAVIKEFPIISSVVTIGREADNDIPLDHPAISRHHARIILQGDTYFVEDLNSTNGTMVNDKKIIKAGIHNQDVVVIAKHSLVFVDDRSVSVSAEQVAKAFESQESAASAALSDAAEPEIKAPPLKRLDKDGGLRITEGVVDQVEFTLKEGSTYIGKSDRVEIKIKGMMAPEVAAMITKKIDGFYLVAIKEGYPKVNGMPLTGERLLNEGDMLELGGTKMQFYHKNAS